MLLKMLQYPGPSGKWQNKKLTDYMTIEPTNEFSERPVLPDPLNIDPPPGNDTLSPQTSSPKQSGRRPQSQPATSNRRSRSGKEQNYKINTEVKAKIIGEWDKGEIEVELPNGEKGILKESRKQVEPLKGKTVTLVVTHFKKGKYYLKLP
jgi:hypothetical protein